MNNFESQFQSEKNHLEENLRKYLERYDAELTEEIGAVEYRQKLEEMKKKLRGLPIAHSTNIDNLGPILQSGLQPFSYRREKNYAKSAISEYDHRYGLIIIFMHKSDIVPLMDQKKVG